MVVEEEEEKEVKEEEEELVGVLINCSYINSRNTICRSSRRHFFCLCCKSD